MYALSRLNGLSSDGAGRLIVVMWEESSMVPYLALLLSALLAVADQLLKLLVQLLLIRMNFQKLPELIIFILFLRSCEL